MSEPNRMAGHVRQGATLPRSQSVKQSTQEGDDLVSIWNGRDSLEPREWPAHLRCSSSLMNAVLYREPRDTPTKQDAQKMRPKQRLTFVWSGKKSPRQRKAKQAETMRLWDLFDVSQGLKD